MPFYFQYAFSTGLYLACSVLAFSLLPTYGLFFPDVVNSGHAFVFFFANLFLLKLLLGPSNTTRKTLFISACSVVIGLLIEFIQPYFGRNRSAIDFIYDLLGIIFSIIIYKKPDCSYFKSNFLMLISFLVLAWGWPMFKFYIGWQINQSPIILNFERNWEEFIYTPSQDVQLEIMHNASIKTPNILLSHSNNSMGKITLSTQHIYSGINLSYLQHDWTHYKQLNWEIFSLHESPFFLTLRVHDDVHNQNYNDRFNYKFVVMPGFNEFEVALGDIKASPKAREMDLSNIRNLSFFISQPSKEIIFYLDNILLK